MILNIRGLKMYIQLPDYGDFHGYELGVDGILSQIDHKIYANCHKPSWKTLQRHLFTAEIARKLFRDPNDVAEQDKRTISNRKGCLAG